MGDGCTAYRGGRNENTGTSCRRESMKRIGELATALACAASASELRKDVRWSNFNEGNSRQCNPHQVPQRTYVVYVMMNHGMFSLSRAAID